MMQETIEFKKQTCCVCGVLFCMTAEHQRRLEKNHKEFYCPNGHKLSFMSETEEDKYKKLYQEEEKKNNLLKRQKDIFERINKILHNRLAKIEKEKVKKK